MRCTTSNTLCTQWELTDPLNNGASEPQVICIFGDVTCFKASGFQEDDVSTPEEVTNSPRGFEHNTLRNLQVSGVTDLMKGIAKDSGGQKWLRCRLMVVGKGRSGKTTLVDSLSGDHACKTLWNTR